MPRHHRAPKSPSAAISAPDGHLPAALRRLGKTVAALVDDQAQYRDNHLQWADSRYQQLRRAVRGQKGVRFGGRNTVPVWTDALDLLTKIDHTVRVWYHAGIRPDDPPTAPTVACRLDTVAHRPWRPQDVRTIDDYSAQLEAWSKRIDTLLADNWRIDLVAPCPACGTETVQREHAGEMVSQHALQIDANGCHCLECGRPWAPEYYRHLARVIGCPLPAGILE